MSPLPLDQFVTQNEIIHAVQDELGSALRQQVDEPVLWFGIGIHGEGPVDQRKKQVPILVGNGQGLGIGHEQAGVPPARESKRLLVVSGDLPLVEFPYFGSGKLDLELVQGSVVPVFIQIQSTIEQGLYSGSLASIAASSREAEMARPREAAVQ